MSTSRLSLIWLNIIGMIFLFLAFPLIKYADYCDRTEGSIWANIRYDIWKLLVDRVGSIILLIMLSPLLIIIALAIMIESSGGILFRQDRYGRNRTIFSILKFRSMYAGSMDGIQASADDPRVTKVGRVIRSLSLDELPQLWNVIRGDMSLVGPRPHAPWATVNGVPYREVVPRYFNRYQIVRPGITGLAQIMGYRGPTDTTFAIRARVRYDLEYIKRRSIKLDIFILLHTIRALSRNAV